MPNQRRHARLNAAGSECPRRKEIVAIELDGRGFTVKLHTAGAHALRLDDRTGTIETGKLADLIILDQNNFDMPIEDNGSTQIDRTCFEGQLVYGQE